MQNPSILVVDDEKNIRTTISRSLAPLGVTVETAVNGEEALEKLRKGSYELVFLDLKMPGMDGIEVLRRLREEGRSTRVVIITAHGSVASAVDAMKLGAADFVQKPFSPVEIRELVTRLREREKLAGSGPDEYQALMDLTKRQITDRNFDSARETARRAIAADPGQPEAYNLFGALLEIAGEWLEAQKFYRAALDIDPTYTPAWANLERTTSLDKSGSIEMGEGGGDDVEETR